ncbi:MAG: hypothetical protein A4E52_02092 [Pelotomaculum sp. PtaB.Bin013]|uniref:Thioredoxin family protein n=1 Tax=Pelotomaculum isophthalicicum JI TaxID=947010 RepID=A0A9X4H283_9FIRM|nr:thioredoxin-like (seleno)protein SaoT [Pelotomaculum isophthalicicum]MDF9408736.1 thioredoxin family protein [Pelotomaculum isophthalicicum JI]OPX82158.1 MAG: hypothetical protein A4E52_02092 [Pelotomaculum sp. PtaB.Bin013]
MPKVQVEFINTCASCAEHEVNIKNAVEKYGDDVELKIYHAGKDVGYLKKYGMIFKGTMIINGRQKIDNLTKKNIEEAIDAAVRSNNS